MTKDTGNRLGCEREASNLNKHNENASLGVLKFIVAT